MYTLLSWCDEEIDLVSLNYSPSITPLISERSKIWTRSFFNSNARVVPPRHMTLATELHIFQQQQALLLLMEPPLTNSTRGWSEITQLADTEQLFMWCQNHREELERIFPQFHGLSEHWLYLAMSFFPFRQLQSRMASYA